MGMLDGEMEGGDEEEDEPETAEKFSPPERTSKASAKSDSKAKGGKEEKQKEEKNWSSVNLAFQDSKPPFKGAFSPLAFTNWCWFRTIRPRLAATKGSLPDLDSKVDYGIDLVEEVLGQYVPAEKEK